MSKKLRNYNVQTPQLLKEETASVLLLWPSNL